MTVLRTLLENLIDYAGLFPPAALPMPRAAENFSRYAASSESWMLGRFVVPVSRLEELEAAIDGAAPPVSAVTGPDLASDLERIARSRLPVDTIECKAAEAAQIESAVRLVPPQLTAYFEISNLGLLPAIRAARARAKIRTGGVTPEAFPTAEAVARFLAGCAEHQVAFKATAGLHHPLRCHRPLTYTSGGPSGWMFGFLNVLLAAILARRGVSRTSLEPLLLEESREKFVFGEAQIEWPGYKITASEIAEARRQFAIAFGSCSFEEPVTDLKSMRLL